MRCGSGGTPSGSFVGGKITDPIGVGSALRQLLARSEIHESRAMVAASDALATFRVLSLPASTPDSNVDSVVAKEFPLDDGRMAAKWVDVRTDARDRVVFATAWDRSLIKGLTDTVKAAGLEPVVVDLKSACIARTVTDTSCIVVDMTSIPTEIVLIDGSVPLLSHHVEISSHTSDDLLPALAEPLRSVIRYASRRPDSGFGAKAPILVASDQPPAPHAMATLSNLLRRPVEALSIPRRVPDIRYATYLACIGLLMRRG
jgi:hypothetical protein